MKQSHIIPRWVGAFYVQIGNSMLYLSILNTGMLLLTFWYTAGHVLTENFLPFINIWTFTIIMVAAFCLLAMLDFIFIYPSRQAFLNEQSCKHENPAMEKLAEIEKKLDYLLERDSVGGKQDGS